ncbi:hypothetical protein, partial [Pedobacter sp. B4-66]|uniref:hypothetical protein n=1 Tax=Pedobacter sp. B4-66 TaxID=2817280 RepID=UPI001BDAFBB2
LQTLFCFILSCSEERTVYNHENNIEELGGNYYFLGDGRESQILKDLKSAGKSRFGKTIIPAEVLRYNFDENYIISETRGNEDGKIKYWIINKKQFSDSIHPVDSLSFYKKIDSLGIKLKNR